MQSDFFVSSDYHQEINVTYFYDRSHNENQVNPYKGFCCHPSLQCFLYNLEYTTAFNDRF